MYAENEKSTFLTPIDISVQFQPLKNCDKIKVAS